jgi:sporulation protein YlmC with PRC-barrel domain
MDADARAIPLSHLRGYRIAEDALDMRGWDVCSAEGRRIGCLDEVLVDTGTRQVRYLDVEVETLIVTGRERHVLIPVDYACLDPGLRRTVVIAGLAARGVSRLPSYARGAAVREGDPAIARPMSAAAPHAAHEPLDLPIRVEPPLIVRPIRLPPQPRHAPGDESVVSEPMPAVPGKLAAKAPAAGAGSRAA